MKPTRRGLAALVVAVGAVLLAMAYGPRSLNAVAAPLFGAVAFGIFQVWRADDLEIRIHPVESGFPETERTVRIDLDGAGIVSVRSEWPDGLEGAEINRAVTLPETITTTVTLRTRGRHDISAPTIHRRDALGLVKSTVTKDETTTVVVYPKVYRGASHETFEDLFGSEILAERQEFDRLREYSPGDPLRDVHWKSSAKRDDFLVIEFEPSNRTEVITIAAMADANASDAMATAAGTMALAALKGGLSVGLRIPGRTIPPAAGQRHATTILEALADATHGDVDGEEADIRIEAKTQDTFINVDGVTHRFAELIDNPQIHRAEEVVPA